MKKAGYILLILVLILQSGGLLLMFNAQQCYIRYQMSEKLKGDKSTFEKLVLTVREYKKSRVDKNEICFNGMMYDVKSVTVTIDKVELLAILDIEEGDIMANIKKFIISTSLPGKELPKQLHQLISLTYLPPYSDYVLINPSKGINIFYISKQDFVSNVSDILSPPPWQV